MGYMRHHAIVVSSSTKELVQEAKDKAEILFNGVTEVSNIIASKTNGYCHILIAPDGSKEGWGHSDAGNEVRKQFVEWLTGKKYENGTLDWVEVMYADDNNQTEICSHS